MADIGAVGLRVWLAIVGLLNEVHFTHCPSDRACAQCGRNICPAAANALCTYNGVDNAKTTASQEFKDAKWVVRAKVLSARDMSDAEESTCSTAPSLKQVQTTGPME